MKLPTRTRFALVSRATAVALAGVLLAGMTPAQALVISPTFESSITGASNAAQIEGAIDSAIATIDGLYTNSVTVPVDFTYTAGASGDLLSTDQSYVNVTDSNYKAALQTDATAHPSNTVLATALANLSKGNDANGATNIAISSALAQMLGLGTVSAATINIASNQDFSFTRPVAGGTYDAIGGLEHELDEVLGGGGAGSTLNNVANGSLCPTYGGFLCTDYGPLDLYRYSAANTPSYSTSSSATSYLSVNGGVTDIVGFNQNSSGDMADFAANGQAECGPGGPGNPTGQYIQDAFSCAAQDEAYTAASPEATMEESIGWDLATAAPEPGSLFLLGAAVSGIAAFRRRRASATT